MVVRRPVSSFTRRRALAGVASVGLTLPVLSACGSDGGDGASDDGGDAAPSGPLATSDVPVGGGVVLTDQKVVVTQPTEGDFKAFSAVCTHSGCLVNEVTDTINCPCHGSQFDISTGDVVGGPAPSPLPGKSVSVQNDEVTVS